MQDNLKIPEHVAIIMDGNGRWAKAQGKPRTFGHTEGAKRVVIYTATLRTKLVNKVEFEDALNPEKKPFSV